MTYQEYEKEVYDWFYAKYNENNVNTFSLRQKANKGAELDYFIGTRKSNYFGTTLWNIPVAYPGSSSDLINIIFTKDGDLLRYYIQFVQTKKPYNDQNSNALELIQSLKPIIKQSFENFEENNSENKMEYFCFYSKQENYLNVHDMMIDLESDLSNLIPSIVEQIKKIKILNPTFIAERISNDLFLKMHEKMLRRVEKYKNNELEYDAEEELIITKEEMLVYETHYPLNQILYGPPGTGKTYHTINKALKILGYNISNKSRKEIKEEYEKNVKAGRIVFTTFHQSMSYEDFIEGIKPNTNENDEVYYEVKDGIFKKLAEDARSVNGNFDKVLQKFIAKIPTNENQTAFTIQSKTTTFDIIEYNENSFYIKPHNSKLDDRKGHGVKIENILNFFDTGILQGTNQTYTREITNYLINNLGLRKGNSSNHLSEYVLIIDEINRGNVSQIFGELITLIEEDKRMGCEEALEVILPYSKKPFGVPPNLYIIGTMNTADRSVEALDTALRRRFVFEEMNANSSLIATDGKSNITNGIVDEIDLVNLLKTMNQRIEKLLDKDHQIGHAFFMSVTSISDLEIVFKNKIIPLLQEYFYGDYGKIGLVLGESFIELETASSSFAPFKHVDNDVKSDYQHKKIFKFTSSETWDYKNIYTNINE